MASSEDTGIQESFLKRKSLQLKRRLANIEQELKSDNLEEMDEADITVKLDIVEKIFSDFVATHEQLEHEDVSEMDSNVPVEATASYASIKTILKRKLFWCQSNGNTERHPLVRQSTIDENQHSIVIQQQRTRLPVIQIPTFNGSYTEWPDFYSMFSTVVGSDDELTKIEKFQHLRSSLTGPALDSIRSLEISDINYEKAISILKSRFDNKRLNFQAHIKDIAALDNVEVGSVAKLRNLSDTVNSHLRALFSMGTKEQIADCLLIQIVGRKLDVETQRKWEEVTPVNELPTWDAMDKFLQRRCQMMENVECAVPVISKNSAKQVGYKMYANTNNRKKALVISNNTTKNCQMCSSQSHTIYTCPHFILHTPFNRFKEAKRLGLCINCLRKGHVAKSCMSSGCRNCSAKHHSLLHIENNVSQTKQLSNSDQSVKETRNLASLESPSSYSAQISEQASSTSKHLSQSSLVVSNNFPEIYVESFGNTVLATAIIFVKNKANSLIPCRAILDSASQVNFITSDFASKLQVKQHKTTTFVSGIGLSNLRAEKIVNIFIKSRLNSESASLSAVVVPSVIDYQPPQTINISNWNIPNDIQLADPLFFRPQTIDLLIGGDLFFEFLKAEKIRIGPGLPILQNTSLGWIVAGGANIVQKANHCLLISRSNQDESLKQNLDFFIRKFWEVENHMEIAPKKSKEEHDCEKHFIENYCRLGSGEFSVRLPFKKTPSALGDSYQSALRRFRKLESRLAKCHEVKEQYSAFMKEYENLDHMSEVKTFPDGVFTYFLPHHCVTKIDSSTTKLRVVFDGSAKTSTGESLNDILLCGPTIQENLFNIILRFRSFNIALTGDICKMYRCVKVSYPDNFMQCILWRDSPSDVLKIYKLDTVTYGTKPASFLSIRSMHQLAMDEQYNYPLGSKIVSRDFYVDDLISGGKSRKEVEKILSETAKLLQKGGFKIRKWCSSDPLILKGLQDDEKESFLKFRDGTDVTKTLGLIWEPKGDEFLFKIAPFPDNDKVTKRLMLSTIAKLYDPLGLVGPIIVKAKVLLQRLWKEKNDWDDDIPLHLKKLWLCLCDEFKFIDKCKFPRRVMLPDSRYEIHAFCDASLTAYGVCVYILSKKNGIYDVQLLCSKSRVAPTQVLTIPRLELCAALLLSELLHSIAQMKIFPENVFCWSDSTTVLSWIREQSSHFQVFVANRISRIQSLTSKMCWNYVPTNMNPADMLSRGASAEEISSSSLWLFGPNFLKNDSSCWPKQPAALEYLPEKRKLALLTSSATKIIDLSLDCKYISSFGRISRVYGYIYKFGASNVSCRKGPLTCLDVERGVQLLIRMIQKCCFPSEYKCLAEKKAINTSSKLISLTPFIDQVGLIRVGGRLQKSNFEFSAQHPIIIPKNHPLTDSIIRYFHYKNMHAGPQSLLATIRLQYWPLGGRKEVSRICNKCIKCFRLRPQVVEHIMGNLPKQRVQCNRAFLISGVDFCGPLYYRSEIRTRAPIKCYISLFVCFATKAVHLELVKNLSTQSFLAALKRFISIRGKPKEIWSDNATNFVGAKNELLELKRLFLSQQHKEAVHMQCLKDGIDWKFIPPRSPHFGGLWEAAVKVAKLHILRTIGLSVLDFDDLRTLIYQISAIMNSRPLCPISENPNDLEILTPAHFLTGAPLTSVVEPDITMLNIDRLDRWQRVCYMQQLFWKKWSTEYLTILQQRAKWQSNTNNIFVGALVLLKDENQPPLKWQMGRVVDVVKGEDGVVRIVSLRTFNGIIQRAAAKVCVLPVDDLETCELSKGGECSATT